MKRKAIKDQVVVLCGASGGIGRVTAKKFAEAGARVVVAARSDEGIQSLVDEITQAGGKAFAQHADTTDPQQLEHLANAAVEAYGTIDTWVHLPGVATHAEWFNITPDEFRQLLEINVIGMHNALKAAVPVLELHGGTFVAIGSVESDMAFPLQSTYAASKHAVLGLIDAVRVELMHKQSPVKLTTIKPAAIDTPFFERAKAKLGVQAAAPPPVYRPEDVARGILYAAEYAPRDLYIGGGGRIFSALNTIAPGIVDRLVAATQWDAQKTDQPKSESAPNGLDGPVPELDRDRGPWHGRPSVYTWIRTNPKTTLALAAAAVGATAAVVHEIAERSKESDSIPERIKARLPDWDDTKDSVSDAWDRMVARVGQWSKTLH